MCPRKVCLCKTVINIIRYSAFLSEVDVNCNGRPDTYGGYGYRGSYRRSLATFRTDEEGSDSLSDLGAAAPHIRERVYDQPPVERCKCSIAIYLSSDNVTSF